MLLCAPWGGWCFVWYASIVTQLLKKVNTQINQNEHEFSPKYPIDFFQQTCYNGTMNTIKDFLHEKGLTQGQVAELLGYSQNYVNQVANGKVLPTPAFRWRWQEAFGGGALRVLDGDGEAKT